MGHSYVGVEHLFMAIIRDRDAVPTQVLARATDPAALDDALQAMMASEEYHAPGNRVFGVDPPT